MQEFSTWPSDAEFYYNRLPLSDLDTLFHTHGIVARITETYEQTLQITVVSGSLGGIHFDFHYYFYHILKLLRIKSDNNIDAFHQNLVEESKLTGLITLTCLSNLRDHIQYWNGIEWVRVVTKGRHRLSASTE